MIGQDGSKGATVDFSRAGAHTLGDGERSARGRGADTAANRDG